MYKTIPGRTWITLLLALLLLQGCGYQLRQSADLPATISPIMINGLNIYSGLGRELAHRLRSGTVEVTTDRKEARSMLRVSSYRQNNRTMSVDSSGKVAQTELLHTLSFDLLDVRGKILVPNQEILVVRNYINTEEQKLGKTTEADQLTEGMQQELARKIIVRMQAHLK
jgi:LPS-assembly lipoprotein